MSAIELKKFASTCISEKCLPTISLLFTLSVSCAARIIALILSFPAVLAFEMSIIVSLSINCCLYPFLSDCSSIFSRVAAAEISST